jgi:D-3-phosphoglycerate dehydrogenase / 2-oxoglutarate reductase
MKILIAEPLDKKVIRDFKLQYPQIKIDVDDQFSQQSLSRQIKKLKIYDALIIRNQTQISLNLVKDLTRLKVIASACTGTDNVDYDALKKLKIKHFNSPNGNFESTAEHVLAMIMALAKNIVPANQLLKKHDWCKQNFISQELIDKTLGIIGLGKIGKTLAQKALYLDMEVIAYDPFLKESPIDDVSLHSLKYVFKKSDFVSINIPGNDETNGLIGKKELAMMKKTSYFVNCARGEVVDEKALYRVCKNGDIRGAALDVFIDEPKINQKLVSLDNVIVTPHIAGQTREALKRNSTVALEKVIKYLLRGN